MAEVTGTGRAIIAVYSPIRAMLSLIFWLSAPVVFVIYWCVALTNADVFFSRHFYGVYALILGSVLSLFMIPKAFSLARRVVFDGMKALWIENGRLIYLDPKIFSIKCSEISFIAPGVVGSRQMDVISIRLKDGTEKILYSNVFSEPVDQIIARMQQFVFGKSIGKELGSE